MRAMRVLCSFGGQPPTGRSKKAGEKQLRAAWAQVAGLGGCKE